MENIYKSFILKKISLESGIVIAPIHSIGLFSYVEKLIKKLNISIDNYCYQLNNNKDVLNDLINKATTNETYFFREEKQFEYLENVLFPKYRNKTIVIWSAACSTGEEPLSLLALALHCHVNAELYASDIDDNVLEFFEKGEYSKYSFRSDGKKFHKYLEEIGNFNENKSKFIIKKEILNKIKIFKHNLTNSTKNPVGKKINLIFIRNVFIYFDLDTRAKITEDVSKMLSDNGFLFYSINEIGNINKNVIPNCLEKENYEKVYFYVKKSSNKNNTEDNSSAESNFPSPCDIFKKINNLIINKDYKTAFTIASDYKPAFSDSYYSSFFKGYVLMQEKKYSDAEKYFSTSEFMKSEFWPVYYFHGMLLEKMSDKGKAKKCFKKCVEKMQDRVNIQDGEYGFLLNNTSPSFIYSYCSKNAEE